MGSILFLFIVIHMADFWATYKFKDILHIREYRTDLSTDLTTFKDIPKPSAEFDHSVSYENNVEIVRVKDLHARVKESFSNIWYVLLYVVAMGTLSFHLVHGFQSAFRTMGWIHRKYTPIVYFIGTWLFAVIIPVGFAAMPIVYYIQSLK